MKTSFKKHRGLTLIEILVIIAILVLLAAFLLPILARPKYRSHISCVNNLKQVGLSFRIWAGDNNGNYPMHVSTNLGGTMELAENPKAFRLFQVLSNELGTTRALVCPQDKSRSHSSNFHKMSNLNISYFVGIDAEETNGTMLLSGDQYITNGLVPKNGTLNLTTNQNVHWSQELHAGKNNVGLADGSVQQVSSKLLRKEILAKTGFATNRIVLP